MADRRQPLNEVAETLPPDWMVEKTLDGRFIYWTTVGDHVRSLWNHPPVSTLESLLASRQWGSSPDSRLCPGPGGRRPTPRLPGFWIARAENAPVGFGKTWQKRCDTYVNLASLDGCG